MEAYRPCHEPFVRYCSALAFGKMDVEDLMQDVLLAAYHQFEQIRKKDQMLHYLIRCARNRCISHWRKKRFQTELLEKYEDRMRAKGVSADTLLEIQWLYRCLDRLPNHQKEALILFEISGFSMKEIAQMQSSSEGAVKTKISRGRKKLQTLLDDQIPASRLSGIFQTIHSIAL